MGFWSYTCAKTHLPILANESRPGNPLTEVEHRHRQNGKLEIVEGVYDGYGRISTADGTVHRIAYEALDDGSAFLLAKRFCGDVPKDFMGVSRRDPAQGHFIEDEVVDFLIERGSMPSHDAYEILLDGVCSVELARTLSPETIQAMAEYVSALEQAIYEKDGHVPGEIEVDRGGDTFRVTVVRSRTRSFSTDLTDDPRTRLAALDTYAPNRLG